MKVLFKNPRRPYNIVNKIDDQNRNTGNRNLAVSSEFSMKNFTVF